MRRRMKNLQRLEEKKRLEAEPQKAPEVPKGTCRKCGQHIGRGVAFHERRCDA